MDEKNFNEYNQEEMTEKQIRILEAAIKVFSEKGFEGSRTSEIAKEAEVAEGTIFKYFRTKKDLLLSLLFPLSIKFLKPFVMKSAEEIIERGKDKPPDEVLRELLMDRLKLIKKNIPLIKTVAIESFYHDELLEPIKDKIAPQVINILDNYVDAHKDNGDFKDYDTRLISRSLMSMLMGYIVLSSILPEYFSLYDDEEEIKKIVDILLNGIKR
ncbi:Fatty acid metabolism regulator protein [Caloramator mitchellensis]|uniref:Fatty acid metabolism regulator protein n=1 Tax=Caloramator mitchellensis TaxID=908809 RepID=A0A0R3JZX8_CALMK|nr:TetR/AcrR family transcriptional regulator [Caloramator mitchellensis]KRQ86540.1 Fatty acid metabolism regulator protein [Caloramator mitchellensis]